MIESNKELDRVCHGETYDIPLGIVAECQTQQYIICNLVGSNPTDPFVMLCKYSSET